jgi:hypothetical protein
MKLTRLVAAAALMCANFSAFAAPAPAEENTYDIAISSPALIKQFINANEGLFYVEKRPFSVFFEYSGEYSRSYLAKNRIGGDINCDAAFISYNGAFIPAENVEEIRIKKLYRVTGFRRLRSRQLFYDISIKGKGMFQGRGVSISAGSLKYFGGQPVKCAYAESGEDAPQAALKYPAAVVIPRDVLAQQHLKDSLKKLNNEDLKRLEGPEKTIAADILGQAVNFS